MPDSIFVGYVGDPDFHDGSILFADHRDRSLIASVRGASGRIYSVKFDGVVSVKANHPQGMILYGLTEMTCEPPIRRFVFANWDDESASCLEVNAECFEIV